MWRDEGPQTEGDVSTGADSNLTIPAATERINEDVMLTTPVAQQETTRSYFLAQTLESTRTIPIVSANLPLDKGPIDVDVVEPDADGEGSNTSEEEDGDDSDDPDPADESNAADDSASGVISTEASDSERSGEISMPVAAASTVIGSFTYRGITYAVEPGGETVAIVAADYTKLPKDFIEAKAIVLPSMVTADGIDYYSVTRIADYAFSSLNSDIVDQLEPIGASFYTCADGEEPIEDNATTDEDPNLDPEPAYIDAITVPATVTSIGDNAFTDFNTLQYILVSDDNQQYSQYDGCLYTADQSCLLLIPEGRLGAVRVAPNTTEISEDASSHCASLESLIVDPDSAASQLLAENADIAQDIRIEMGGLVDAFAYKNLGEIERSKGEEQITVHALFGNKAEDAMVLFSNDFASLPNGAYIEALMLSSESMQGGAISLVSSLEEPTVVNEDSRAVLNASLPTWATTITNKMAGSPTVTLYESEDYSTATNIDGKTYGYITNSSANFSINSSSFSNKTVGDTVSCYSPTAYGSYGGYIWTSAIYQLRYDPSLGFYVYVTSGTASGHKRGLVKVASSSATTGTLYKCTAALRVEYATSTSPFEGVPATKSFYLLIPPYGVQWNANGGIVSPSQWLVPVGDNRKLSDSSSYSSSVGLPTPTRDGYIFGGWYSNSACTGSSVGASTAVNSDVTYYAKWLSDYTITWNPNGGNWSGSTASKTTTVPHGSATSKYGTDPVRTGYTFLGWGSTSSASSNVTSFPTSTTANATYYARWRCTITWNPNGGNWSGETASKTSTVDWGNATSKYGTDPKKDGCSFLGWGTTSSATSNASFPSSTTANTTYYARWIVNPVVTWNPNGGNWSGSTANKTTEVPYGTATSKYGTDPKKDGYTFLGWGTTSSASANVASFPSSTTANATYYARWRCTITWNPNGGNWSGETADKTNTVDWGQATSKYGTDPKRTGYEFTGWGTTSNATSNVASFPSSTTANATYYARWTANTYTITLDRNNGTGVKDTVYLKYGVGWYVNSACTTTLGSIAKPTKTGYDYKGYATTSTATSGSYWTDVATKPALDAFSANTTLYAAWSTITYKITAKPNGGTIENKTTDWTKDYNIESANITLPTPVWKGHTFLGWTGTGLTSAQKNVTVQTGSTGNKTYTATWETDQYDLTLKVLGTDGKTWTETTSKYAYGSTVTLPTKPNETGYTFDGWYTDEGFKSKVSGNPSSTTEKDLVFYARYTANKYKISFDANGGTGGIKGPIDATYMADMPSLGTNWKPENKGYDFTGWYLRETVNGEGELRQYYEANGTSSRKWDKASDATLEAGWSRMPFNRVDLVDELSDQDKTIWYWPEKGYVATDADNATVVAKDSKIVDKIAFDDYEFLGWYDGQGANAIQMIDADGNLKTDKALSGPATWYAKWKRLACTVELKASYGSPAFDVTKKGTESIQHVAFGEKFSQNNGGAIEKPTRTGYTFLGYYTKENPELSTDEVKANAFQGEQWIDKDGKLSDKVWTEPEGLQDKAPVILYAAWQLNDSIVSFDVETVFDEAGDVKQNIEEVAVHDGGASLADRKWNYGKNATEKLPVPSEGTFTRNGYDFDGWYYLKDGKTVTRVCDKEGNPSSVLKPWKNTAEEVTLYAYWTPKKYTLQFDPAYPAADGVEKVYESKGGKTQVKLAYDDDLSLVSPEFGAYVFDGWFIYAGEGSDGQVLYGASIEEHMTDGRFTPQGDLTLQFDPSTIKIVGKWSKPEPKHFYLFVGAPGEVREDPVRQDAAREYDFAEVITFTKSMEPDWVPGWQFADWAMVDTEEEALELAKSGATLEDEEAYKGFGPVTTKADYHDYYFVARWSACELSVKLADDEVENGYYVKGTDAFLNADSWNAVATGEDSNRAVYRVTDDAFTLPNLTRRGYDFKGWVREGDDRTEPELDVTIMPSQQALKLEDYSWTFYPVFEEIEYTIVLEPNVKATVNGKNGGYERQEYKKMFTDTFTFPYPTSLNTGACFSAWANESEEPYRDNSTYKEFHQGENWPLAPGVDDNGGATFCLTDLTDDVSRTITLYGIWHAGYNVEVPLFANMAIDTETGDVAAGTVALRPKDTNDVKGVYQVESIRYEPVIDEETGQVPFQNEKNVYLSVYAGVEFQNADEGYFFLQRSKVDADTGEVSYTDKGGDSRKATPLLVKLGSTTPYLFVKETVSVDPTPSYTTSITSLSDVTTEHNGFVPFKAGTQGGLSVRYGLLVAESDADMKKTLKKYVFSEDATSWTLPKNDAGYQRYTGLDEDAGRRLGWSSDTVDIAKLIYTVSRSEAG